MFLSRYFLACLKTLVLQYYIKARKLFSKLKFSVLSVNIQLDITNFLMFTTPQKCYSFNSYSLEVCNLFEIWQVKTYNCVQSVILSFLKSNKLCDKFTFWRLGIKSKWAFNLHRLRLGFAFLKVRVTIFTIKLYV